MSGPFAMAAEELWRQGFIPLPCPMNDGYGKKPGVRFKDIKSHPDFRVIKGWIARFADANVAVLPGMRGLTVVDLDDISLMPNVIRRFGETPLITSTPSNGRHLWYRSSGERCSNLRQREGLAIDIKGLGGIVVVPPSRRLTGPHAGRVYAFERGTTSDVEGLPTLRPGSLRDNNAWTMSQLSETGTGIRISPGSRNKDVFRSLLRDAPFCSIYGDLLDCANGHNSNCEPPLSEDEVSGICKSVWNYQRDGRNFVGLAQRVYIATEELDALARKSGGSDALMLLLSLRRAHWNRPVFAASPDAMARHSMVPGWANSPHRYRRALLALVEVGLLSIVHRGGRGPRDPRIFAFSSRTIDQGK